MKVRLLGKTEQEVTGANWVTIIGHKDASGDGTVASGGAVLSVLPATTAGAMPAYGTTGTDTLPLGTVVRLVGMVVTETFVGASITAITMTSGDATTGAAIYLAATQIGGTGGTNIVYARGTIATNEKVYIAADTVDVTFAATGANLSVLTAGEVILYWDVRDLTQLPTV